MLADTLTMTNDAKNIAISILLYLYGLDQSHSACCIVSLELTVSTILVTNTSAS